MPPITTRQVARPAMPSRHIDWLSLTCHIESERDQERAAQWAQNALQRYLRNTSTPPTPWRWERAQPHHGYKAAVADAATGASIQWAGTPEQGIHLLLPGRACARMHAIADSWVINVVRGFERRGVVALSRIDWAINTEDLLPTYFILGRKPTPDRTAMLPGPMVRTRLTSPLKTAETEAADGRSALTVYYGSRQGGTYVRIYDKARQLAGSDISECRRLAPWYRLEYELHDETAQKSYDAYADGGWERVAGYLASRLALVQPSATDGNQSRWPLADVYARALGKSVPYKPTPSDREPTSLSDRLGWLQDVAGRTLSEAEAAYGWQAVSDYLQGAVVLYRDKHPASVPTTPTP